MLISDKLAEVPDFAGWGGEEGKGGKAPGKGGPGKGKGSCEGMGGEGGSRSQPSSPSLNLNRQPITMDN